MIYSPSWQRSTGRTIPSVYAASPEWLYRTFLSRITHAQSTIKRIAHFECNIDILLYSDKQTVDRIRWVQDSFLCLCGHMTRLGI